MPALKWLRLPRNHVPDKYEHLVRYLCLLLQPRARCGQKRKVKNARQSPSMNGRRIGYTKPTWPG
jgi:hypothetical protein